MLKQKTTIVVMRGLKILFLCLSKKSAKMLDIDSRMHVLCLLVFDQTK